MINSSRLDYWNEIWRRYKRNKSAVISLLFIFILVIVAITADWIAPYDPFKIDLKNMYMPPHSEHIMGTDSLGRDVLSRVIWGSQVSLSIGIISVVISMFIGIPLGAISGYLGGRVDDVIMRIVDLFLTLPTFFLILLIVSILGPSIYHVMIVIGITTWPSTTRLIRAEFLTFRERPFIEAARVSGASNIHIVFKEIMPNALFTAIINGSLLVASAIMTESSLSFLGLGDPNRVSWGFMLNNAMKGFLTCWWTTVFPGIMIVLTVMSMNIVGEGLNEAFNPALVER